MQKILKKNLMITLLGTLMVFSFGCQSRASYRRYEYAQQGIYRYGNPVSYKHFVMGQVHFSKKQWEEAVIELQKAVRYDSKQPHLRVYLALALFENSLHELALVEAQVALFLDDSCAWAWFVYGKIALHLGNIKEAQKGALHSHRLDPDVFEYLELSAKIANSQAQYEKAFRFYRRAVFLEPTQSEIYMNAAELGCQLGFVQECITFLAGYVKKGGTDFKKVLEIIPEGQTNKQEILLVYLFEKILEKQPLNFEVRKKLLELLANRGNGSAIGHIEFLALEVENDDDYLNLVLLMLKLKKPYMAREMIDDRFGTNPQNFLARSILAQIDDELLRYEVAEELRKSINEAN